ncbi:alkaline phosphatase family protein [Pseudomonas sp. 148P]|uniref:Alkaline phosphatase family protein n=1 Tax=Pseudomonas ulcerans TaxID=3115852 RepID=A0ABU7HNG8_9PSED|nr:MULTISPECIES: nucleotide pyrophosphatase/phosphodiesterase family protein [unclassified Pseudomonas]MEE1922590.1 alkaline phosphatase family protein [Pseudomonas sp. 147P]MEE1933064.1 alkaline phosphatase family protein [Pseudomonas sp. 148P]
MALEMDVTQRSTWPGLANLSQSILTALGAVGFRNGFELTPSSATCLLLIDGLGHELLREHAAHAPFLAALMRPEGTFHVGFPATTASSLAALASGLGSGAHGIVGCTFALDGDSEFSPLTWTCAPFVADRLATLAPPPERFIAAQTAWEQASEQGLKISTVMSARYADSAYTKAIYRGSQILGAPSYYAYPELVREALNVNAPAYCFAYFGDLDFAGHLFGPGSEAWLAQLRVADRLAEAIFQQLPPGARLMITADHGMLGLDSAAVVDFDREPGLQEGVVALAGDIRARHVYVDPARLDRTQERWRDRLGDGYRVLNKAQAIGAGLFGDVMLSQAEARIGDLIVVPNGAGGIIRSEVEPAASRWLGHHGALTDADQVVPLLMC